MKYLFLIVVFIFMFIFQIIWLALTLFPAVVIALADSEVAAEKFMLAPMRYFRELVDKVLA